MINYVIQLIIDQYIEVLLPPPKKPSFCCGFLREFLHPEKKPGFCSQYSERYASTSA